MEVIACLACSLDGKITAPGQPAGSGFGSTSDMNRLKALRDSADAVLIGAETFRNYPKPRKGLAGKPVSRHYILTASGNIDSNAPLFGMESGTQATIYSPQPVSNQWPLTLPWRQQDSVADAPSSTISNVLNEIANDGVSTLLIEGGGQVMSLFLQAQAIHRLYLTICPVVVGGTTTPSLVSGKPFTWGNLPNFETLALVQNGDELFWDLSLKKG